MRLGGSAKTKARRPAVLGWLVLAVAAVLGLATTSSGWTTSLSQRIEALAHRVNTGTAADDLPTLVIDMAFNDYNTILAQRERALSSGGVNLAAADDFVNATLREGEKTVSARIRLQQGIIAELGPDDKWPFEVRVDDDALSV
ncbi:MAG: hypothetical protein ACP5JG_16765, partial [Anaerolineae bacterium]